MGFKRFWALFVLTLAAYGAIANEVVWQSDFSKGEDVGGFMFGPPLDGYDFRGAMENRTFGKQEKVTVVYKGVASDNLFLAAQNFKLTLRNDGKAGFYYFYEKFATPVKLEKGLFFSGYLSDGGAKDVCVKLCPSIRTVSLKDGKPVSFELRSGGYSARAGMAAQHKENWFLTNTDLYLAAKRECEKMNADLSKCQIVGWALLVNNIPTGDTVTLHVEGVKLYRRAEIANRLKDAGPNLGLGKSYTLTPAPNAFPGGHNGDPMCSAGNALKKLTDGNLASRCWFDPATAGWWTDRFVNVTIDLGKEEAVDAVAFRISSEFSGARVPAVSRVFVSNRPGNYYLAGEMDKSGAMRQWLCERDFGLMDGNPHAWLVIDNLKTKGRYVTLSLQATTLYLDEIAVFGGSLDKSTLSHDGQIAYASPDITPFYKHTRGFVARETPIPLVLMMPSWTTKYSLYVDVPPTLRLIAPASEPCGSVTFDGVEYARFRVKSAAELYFATDLPAGSRAMIRLTGIDDGKGGDLSAVSQILPLEVISIPETAGFKRLVCSVTFADFPFWSRWPETAKNYKKLGLNWFAPFGHADYFGRLHKSQNPEVLRMIAEAKQAGLKVGGNLSPFCNNQINSPLVTARKAIYLESGAKAAVNCPRVYLDEYVKHPENFDLNSALAAARAGLDFMLFDSEPSWNGAICRCPVCEEAWSAFLRKNGKAQKSLAEVWKNNDRVYKELAQSFWDEFHAALWRVFRDGMAKAAPGGKAPLLGFYGRPSGHESPGSANDPGFEVLRKNGLLDFGNGTLYNIPTEEYGKLVRELRLRMPQEMPLYLWTTAGDTSMSYEQNGASLRNQLYLLFTNGAQGAIFYSALGMDASEYAVLAEVIRLLRPYEDLIADGRLIDRSGYTVPDGTDLSGVSSGNQTLLAVGKYDNVGGSVAITAKAPFSNARLLTGGKLERRGDTLTLTIPPGEEHAVQLLQIER